MCFKQDADRLRLIVAMLKQQPATGTEAGSGVRGNTADGVETVRPGDERRLRLEANITLRQMLVVRANIGRIADDHIELCAVKRPQPFPQPELYISNSKACGIALCYGKRGRGKVGSDEVTARTLRGNGQRDRARAGAKIGDVPFRIGGDE